MNGKIIGIVLLASGAIAGAALYYLQVYGYYDEVRVSQVDLTTLDGTETAIDAVAAEGIDSESSPIRYRACFDSPVSLEEARELYTPYDGPTAPRNAPGWFDCFDAQAIGAAVASGEAEVFLGRRNLEYGIDRVVAITDQGRGYVWHEVNDCGDKLYDGSPKGTDCPER